MNPRDPVESLRVLALLDRSGVSVDGAQMVDAALAAILAGVESTAAARLAGLGRNEVIDEAPDLFREVLVELGIEPPADVATARQQLELSLPGLCSILRPFRDDLMRTIHLSFDFRIISLCDEEVGLMVTAPSGIGTGLDLILGASPARNAALVAEVLQQAVIEEMHGAWPRCPSHPEGHPLTLGDSHWFCPTTRERVAPLGQLGQTHG